MSHQLQTSVSTSDPVEAKGMSDEEELRRFAASYNETVGLGEVIYDMTEELEELGIKQEKV